MSEEAVECVDRRRESQQLDQLIKAEEASTLRNFVSNYLQGLGLNVAEVRSNSMPTAWNQFDKWKDRHY